jgi:spore germination protein KC
MKMKVAAVFMLAIIMTLASGCWGEREMEEIGVVILTGIDLEPDGIIRMTVHSVEPFGAATDSSEKLFTWIGTATGENVMEAERNLRSSAARTLIWLHSKIIVIGKDMAEYGLEKVLDYLARNREFRYNSNILISEGKAFDMLQVPPSVQKNLAKELEGMILNTKEWSKSYVSDLRKFLVAACTPTSGVVTARVGYLTNDREFFSGGKEEYMKMDKDSTDNREAFMEGTAVFKNSKLVGWLDGDETRGYLWIKGKASPGAVVYGKLGEDEEMAIESIRAKSRVEFFYNGGVLTARINLAMEGSLEEHESGRRPGEKEDLIGIEKEFANIIESEMRAAMVKAQQWNCDIFNFLVAAGKSHGLDGKQLEENWDKIFPEIQVEYNVKVTISRTGMVLDRLSG